MSKEPYFVPLTLKDLEELIHETIRDCPDIDGTELIVGGKYVYDEDDTAPQGTIVLGLAKNELGEDKEYYGSLVMSPKKARTLQ